MQRVRSRHLALTVAAVAVLGGCSGGGAEDEVAADDPAAVASDDAPAPTDDDVEDEAPGDAGPLPAGDPGVLVQFRGESLVAGPDTGQGWVCAVTSDQVTFGFVDEDGNEVDVTYQDGGGTTAIVSLADGTTWNQTEGGVANLSEQGDGTYRLSIQLTAVDSGESESMDARLTC